MDRINKVNQVVGIFKSRIEGPVTPEKSKQTKNSKVDDDLLIQSSKQVEDLKNQLKRRLKAINKTEPDYLDKLERIYIESTLTHEFGDDINNDIAFTGMVNDIKQQLTSHPELKNKLEQSIELLLSD